MDFLVHGSSGHSQFPLLSHRLLLISVLRPDDAPNDRAGTCQDKALCSYHSLGFVGFAPAGFSADGGGGGGGGGMFASFSAPHGLTGLSRFQTSFMNARQSQALCLCFISVSFLTMSRLTGFSDQSISLTLLRYFSPVSVLTNTVLKPSSDPTEPTDMSAKYDV